MLNLDQLRRGSAFYVGLVFGWMYNVYHVYYVSRLHLQEYISLWQFAKIALWSAAMQVCVQPSSRGVLGL